MDFDLFNEILEEKNKIKSISNLSPHNHYPTLNDGNNHQRLTKNSVLPNVTFREVPIKLKPQIEKDKRDDR
jgi:hypothetical protein